MGVEQNGTEMEGFTLGRPALICRWRLAGRMLPLENRHLRAFGQRVAGGRPISPQLVAWAKQHIEWTLSQGAAEYPDGVLMTIVDDAGRAAMTVGPHDPLRSTTASALADRARRASLEASLTGVAPESLWVFHGDSLIWGIAPGERPSGAATLMADLAATVGFPLERRAGLADGILDGEMPYDEVLLVSDEHGIVAANNAPDSRAERFVEGYGKLLDSVRDRRNS